MTKCIIGAGMSFQPLTQAVSNRAPPGYDSPLISFVLLVPMLPGLRDILE
jgi:dTDP-glucose pyrophosphorylase